MLREVAARVPLHRGTTAVDVGCGTGEVVPLLRECGWDPIGVDFDAAMLTAAKRSVLHRSSAGTSDSVYLVLNETSSS